MAGEKRKKERDIKRIILPLQALYISSLIHPSIIAIFCRFFYTIYLNAEYLGGLVFM